MNQPLDEKRSLLGVVLAALLRNEYAVRDVQMQSTDEESGTDKHTNRSSDKRPSEPRINQVMNGQLPPTWRYLGILMERLQDAERKRLRPLPKVVAVKTYVLNQCEKIRDEPESPKKVKAMRELLDEIRD